MHLLSVFSLRNRALIALVTICAAVFGVISLTSLKQELIPSLDLPQLFVVTTYPGATPEVVEQDVSTPIESAIQGVEGLDTTTATSQTNASTVTASFDYGTNITNAEQKVSSAINRIKSTLPDSVDPQVITFSLSDLPVVQLAVTSDLSGPDLAQALDDSVLPSLRDLDDVSDVSLLGTTTQRLVITPDDDALAKLGLTSQAIRDALDANGDLFPSGSVDSGDDTLTVQAGSQLTSAQDVADLPVLGAQKSVATPSAIPGQAPTVTQVPDTAVHTIADVATVKLEDDPVTGYSRVNGDPSVTIAITKSPEGNTVDVSREVQNAIPDLEKAVGHGTSIQAVFDQAPFIEQSIDSLTTEGLLGLVFAIIVILVFLLSIRSTLVTAISIPVSVLITFIGMLGLHYSLNIITLGALTIAIGRVVDDSIVVIENIKRHLAVDDPGDLSPREAKATSIRAAVREVAGAVTASTITTVAVFLPLAFVSDVTGELFRPFALTVTIALAASLFVALTIVPVLAYWFLGTKRSATEIARAQAPDELERPTALQRVYVPILRWTLRFRWVTVLAALVVLGLTLVPVGLGALKTNFLGDSGQNTLSVTQALPNGTSLEKRNDEAMRVEQVLAKVDGVDIVQLSLGDSGGSSLRAAFGSGTDATFSITTDADADQTAVQQRVRDALDGLSDAGDLEVSTGQGGFASSDIEVDITAGSEADLREAADRVLAKVKDLDVTAQATSDLSDTQPFVEVAVDRAKAAQKGLSDSQVSGIVAGAMNPSAVGSVVIDDTTISIYIAEKDAPTTLDEVKAFAVPTGSGTVRLDSIATVKVAEQPASVTTIKGRAAATVTVTPHGDDVGTASTAVQNAVDDADLPASADATLGGVTSQQGDAFGQLGYALLAAILIVYVVMVATFKSLRQPILLLVSVPFAATGALVLQLVSNIPLGVSSIIGAVMLVGIVVTNSIVLVDLVNQYRVRGLSVRDAVIHGAARRLRPILMTALATIFALVPLASGLTGHGSFISQPLAITVIGGLVSSTLLTLIVLPTLYYLVEGARERRAERRARRQGGTDVAAGRPSDGATAASTTEAPPEHHARHALEPDAQTE